MRKCRFCLQYKIHCNIGANDSLVYDKSNRFNCVCTGVRHRFSVLFSWLKKQLIEVLLSPCDPSPPNFFFFPLLLPSKRNSISFLMHSPLNITLHLEQLQGNTYGGQVRWYLALFTSSTAAAMPSCLMLLPQHAE